MSQEFLLKTPAAPAAPKLDNAKVSNQAEKVENTDEPSFSSTLDKQVEQNDPPKKESVEKAETSANHPDENITENTDNEQGGNSLPEKTTSESEASETKQEITADSIDVDLDVSIVTELKNQPAKSSTAKLVSAEQLISAKAVTAEKVPIQSLNKQKTAPVLGSISNAELLGKGDNVSALELDKKLQTTSLRSDIFHALSKNKAAESISLDDATKALLSKATERSPANFATALTSATTLNTVITPNSATAQPVLAVQPAIQSAAWNQVLSSRVVWMAREGIQEASLRLNPANLGAVEVKLNMHNDQANVLFIAQNAATRDALEQALPRLRESFAENGMQLADAEVADQELEQSEDEQTSGERNRTGNEQSPSDIDNDQQATISGQDLEVGLSVYA